MSRKLWRERLPSRTLSNLEARILGAQRNEEDIPGWMVPSIYFEFLRDGDARQIKRVFYHNEIDVLSLGALLQYISDLLSRSHTQGINHASDLLAIGRVFEDLGQFESAINLYIRGLDQSDDLHNSVSNDQKITATFRCAMIYKRMGMYKEAV